MYTFTIQIQTLVWFITCKLCTCTLPHAIQLSRSVLDVLIFSAPLSMHSARSGRILRKQPLCGKVEETQKKKKKLTEIKKTDDSDFNGQCSSWYQKGAFSDVFEKLLKNQVLSVTVGDNKARNGWFHYWNQCGGMSSCVLKASAGF